MLIILVLSWGQHLKREFTKSNILYRLHHIFIHPPVDIYRGQKMWRPVGKCHTCRNWHGIHSTSGSPWLFMDSIRLIHFFISLSLSQLSAGLTIQSLNQTYWAMSCHSPAKLNFAVMNKSFSLPWAFLYTSEFNVLSVMPLVDVIVAFMKTRVWMPNYAVVGVYAAFILHVLVLPVQV